MGLKLSSEQNPVECSFKEGVLTFYLADEEFTIPIPAIRTLVFKRQNNFYSNKRVFAYLFNDTYVMVLRTDGTGSIYTKVGRYICTLFTFDRPKFDMETSYYGSLSAGNGYMYTLTLTYFKDYRILSALNYPFLMIFKKEENSAFMNDSLHRLSDAMPVLTYRNDGSVVCLNPETTNIIYEVKGHILVDKSGVIPLRM